MIRTKRGVWILEFNEPFMEFLRALSQVGYDMNYEPTITSGGDGEHMEGSLHYKGLAWDLRVRDCSNRARFANELRSSLNAIDDNWDVLYGDQYHLNHIHVEYDPKGD